MRTDETEELELTDEEQTSAVAEQEAEAERLAAEETQNPLPNYITAEQYQAGLEANNAKLIEQMRSIVQPQQVQQQVVQEDARPAYVVAVAEAEALGKSPVLDQDWISQRALEIASDRQQKAFDAKLSQAVQQIVGLVSPVVTSNAISAMTGGDQALAAEVQQTLTTMGVGPDTLQNEHVKALILDASRARLADKSPARKPMPGAAPASSSVVNTVTGIEARLTPAQRKQLAAYKVAYPGAYDDPAAIAEEFGVN